MDERKGRSSVPWGARFSARAGALWDWFFPPPIELTPPLRRLLRALYPSLRLERIRLHRGLPHLVRLLGSQAIALPALWAPRRVRLYFDPDLWRPDSPEGLGTLAHEAFHAQQIQDTGWGIGPFRPFLWLYFACGAANGFRYEGHPMESDAYLLAGRRSSLFEAGLRSACGPAPDGGLDLERAEILSSSIARTHSDVDFWRRLGGSLPLLGPFLTRIATLQGPRAMLAWALAAPLLLLWLGIWVTIAALAWLLLAAVEAVGLVAAGTLRLLARAR